MLKTAMPRKPSFRYVRGDPGAAIFKPAGIPARTLEEVVLGLDEFEAVRLSDKEGMYQSEAAERMEVSRATYGRILESARRKIAEALVAGKALRIEGGPIYGERWRRYECAGCAHQWVVSRKRQEPAECPSCAGDSIDESSPPKRRKESAMKIAVTAKGSTLGSDVDPRFGRASTFIIYDTESGEAQALSNAQGVALPGGAGIQAAQTIHDHGAEVLLTGHCGPNAFRTLQAAGVEVFIGASGKVSDAIEAYEKGELTPADSPDVEGHWK
jgi:predicted DNA-binding protein (UPF0251 family)/predicted Fe-Mo cluster-binding NifX family protein